MMNERTRTGRRPGESSTREAILAAASRAFAERGLSGATMRSIAAEAGVDPALLSHYFGSKQGLFVEAVRLPVDPAALVARLQEGPAETAAERAVSFFFQVWEQEPIRAVFLSLLRAAFEDEQAAALLRRRLESELVGPAIASLGVDQPELRTSLIATQVTGLVTVRYILRFEPLASLPANQVAAAITPTFQRYLTGPLEESSD